MRNKQKGFSLIELLIVVAIILIIAAIAIPNLLRSKMAANEASAVGSVRTLNTACVTYSTTYTTYPTTLANLGPATSATSATADLVDSVLATGTKSGYVFTYRHRRNGCQWQRSRLHHQRGPCDPGNDRSAQLLQRSVRCDSRRRNDRRIRHQHADQLMHSVIPGRGENQSVAPRFFRT